MSPLKSWARKKIRGTLLSTSRAIHYCTYFSNLWTHPRRTKLGGVNGLRSFSSVHDPRDSEVCDWANPSRRTSQCFSAKYRRRYLNGPNALTKNLNTFHLLAVNSPAQLLYLLLQWATSPPPTFPSLPTRLSGAPENSEAGCKHQNERKAQDLALWSTSQKPYLQI